MNEADRELLEMAAKAAGYSIESITEDGNAWVYKNGSSRDEFDEFPIFLWKPHHDDGDALRLAVKCGITDLSMAVGELVLAENCQLTGVAIVRRAIVRAAAEIGKAMP